MKISKILEGRGDVIATIEPHESVLVAVRKLVDRNIGSLLVVEPGLRLIGIISERDILRECNRSYLELDKTQVGAVMTRGPVCGHPDDDILQAQALMTEHRIRHLPIVQGERIVGIVSAGDIVKYLQETAEVENRDLKDYISGKYLNV
jgi:CBS domain-containing protein